MKNETFKKVTGEFRTALVARIADKMVSDLIIKTKATSDGDTGTFKVIASTADIDRSGESVNQAGWDLTFYKSNPVVLWAHDYSSLPIGICTSVSVADGRLVAEGKFAPADANPFAQQVRRLYELGMVRATSVGFIPKEYDQNNESVINKSELLEFSFVPVPANPYALSINQIKNLHIDANMLKTKGIEITTKDEEVPVVPPVDPVTPPVPVEPAPEVKGEVSNELQLIEMQEEKWEKYCEICEALDAFCSVYFDEKTPVEDFPKLLNEMIDILKVVASDDGMDEDDIKTFKAGIAKMLGDRKSIRIKLDSNAKILKDTLENILKNNIILGSVKLSEGGENNGGDKTIKKRSNSSALEEINDFVEARELLRSVDISVEKVLRKFNHAAQDRQKK